MDDIQRAKWLNRHLRRISRMWPPANQALALAKTRPGRYRCAICTGEFLRADVHRDHIAPVIDPATGITGTLDLVNRMFCPVENYQIVCVACHQGKSTAENKERAACRKKSKASQPK